MTSSRSADDPSGLADHRVASHDTSAMPVSETVYTFSFTTDWFHTVNAVAPITAANTAPAIRSQRDDSQSRKICSVIRNQSPAAAALDTAARTLMRAATVDAIGSSENRCPMITKNGLPGGCGSPNE